MSKPSRTAELEAARLLLSRVGVSPEQLLGEAAIPASVPTFGEYIPRVAAVVTPGTRQVYQTYWRRLRKVWATRQLSEPTPLEISDLAEQAKLQAVCLRNSRGGRTAAEHMISATRCLYKYAGASLGGVDRAEAIIRGFADEGRRVQCLAEVATAVAMAGDPERAATLADQAEAIVSGLDHNGYRAGLTALLALEAAERAARRQPTNSSVKLTNL